jgi:hypothetical protein
MNKLQVRKILSKILFCEECNLDNVLLHIPVGAVLVAVSLFSPPVAVIFGIGFIFYELNEQRIIQDKAYPALQGWLWGIGLLAIILLIVR